MASQEHSIPDILLKIVATKKEELKEKLKHKADFSERIKLAASAIDFPAALAKPGLSIIAEIKKASPSAGVISNDFDPIKIAAAYKKAGADAVSVLTDISYFQGSPSYIRDVRRTLDGVPILCKDFIIDPIQIYEARANGADTFLLISEILEISELRDLIAAGRELGMEPLIESHGERELEKALNAGARVLGINNRNLRDFKVDIACSERLVRLIPDELTAVSESGIKTPEDAARMAAAGFDAILAGESVMRSGLDGCGAKILELKGGRCL